MVLTMTRRPRRSALPALAAAALVVAAPGPGAGRLDAQIPEPAAVAPAPAGWLGVSVQMNGTVDARGGRHSLVHITDVRPGGPAERAGLQAGDVLLSINGRSPASGFVEMVGDLEPGDPVTVLVRRDGEERRFRFRAGSRPTEMPGPVTYTVLLEADTLAEQMYRAMDSLRARIALGEGPAGLSTVRLTRRVGETDSVVTVLRRPVGVAGPREIRLPAVPGLSGEPTEGAWVASPEPSRPFRLLFLPSDSPRVAPGVAAVAGGPTEVRQWTGQDGREVEVTLRPLAPYTLGRNRAAGAEIVELKPELAEYFAVERGVLVVDVAPGTPAALAGMQPGDVLVRIGSVGVGSVGDVRASLTQPQDSLPVVLVRKGRRLEVVLRR